MTIDRSYLHAAESMGDAEAGQFFRAVIRFGLDGTEPESLSGSPAVGFALVRPTLEKGRARAIAGEKGGKAEAKPKQTASKPQAKPKQTVSKKSEVVMPDMTWASDAVRGAVEDWLAYKASRGDKYKQIGLNKLVGEIEKKFRAYGDMVVVDAINGSIANGWQGIIWDRVIPAAKSYRPGSQAALNAAMTERVRLGSAGLDEWQRQSIRQMLAEPIEGVDGDGKQNEESGYQSGCPGGSRGR